ncbi:unnamed protein product [Phytophthora lilii]|uniref:Unnamed protein product n=1 Tax=Phytophthora lilii TaxID=2077276 RepID=A0A9W6TDE3_9STRA|nr:unnamed protein product [Phytophthora lilii]
MLLVWSILGRIDGSTNYSLLNYKNQNGHFNLKILDIMGNGLVTPVLLLVKISYRKRKTLCARSSRIECAILRVGLKLEVAALVSSTRMSELGPKEAPNCPLPIRIDIKPPAVVQQLQFVKTDQTFKANCVLLPINSTHNVQVPAFAARIMYAVGVTGLLLACIIPFWKWNLRTDVLERALSHHSHPYQTMSYNLSRTPPCNSALMIHTRTFPPNNKLVNTTAVLVIHALTLALLSRI